MMHTHELPDWFLVNEIDLCGTWSIREGAPEAPALRIAHGTEENMRMAAAAIKMAKLLGVIYRTENFDKVMYRRRIEAVLREAGIAP